MNTLREVAQQALEALTNCNSAYGHRCIRCDSEVDEGGKVASALRAALAQQAEPVEQLAELQAMLRAEVDRLIAAGIQPQRKLVPLTEEEIDAEWRELDGEVSTMFMRVLRKFARAVERAVWEKNHG